MATFVGTWVRPTVVRFLNIFRSSRMSPFSGVGKMRPVRLGQRVGNGRKKRATGKKTGKKRKSKGKDFEPLIVISESGHLSVDYWNCQ